MDTAIEIKVLLSDYTVKAVEITKEIVESDYYDEEMSFFPSFEEIIEMEQDKIKSEGLKSISEYIDLKEGVKVLAFVEDVMNVSKVSDWAKCDCGDYCEKCQPAKVERETIGAF